MLVFLHLFLFRPVLRLIDARREATTGTSTRASDMKARAAALAADVTAQLADIRTAAASEKERMLAAARVREKQVLEAASIHTRGQMATARRQMDLSAQDVRRQLAGEVDALADAVAARLMRPMH